MGLQITPKCLVNTNNNKTAQHDNHYHDQSKHVHVAMTPCDQESVAMIVQQKFDAQQCERSRSSTGTKRFRLPVQGQSWKPRSLQGTKALQMAYVINKDFLLHCFDLVVQPDHIHHDRIMCTITWRTDEENTENSLSIETICFNSGFKRMYACSSISNVSLEGSRGMAIIGPLAVRRIIFFPYVYRYH